MYKFTSHIIPVEARKQISVIRTEFGWLSMDRAFLRGKMGCFHHLLMIFFKVFSKKYLSRIKMESVAVPGMVIHWGAATLKSAQVFKFFRKMEGGQHRMLLLEALCKAKFRESLVQFCCNTKFLISLSALSALFLRDKMYIPWILKNEEMKFNAAQ